MTIELDTTLAQAEVLFLSFQQIVADIDRRRVEQGEDASAGLRRRRVSGSASAEERLSSVALPVISDELRELLNPGRR